MQSHDNMQNHYAHNYARTKCVDVIVNYEVVDILSSKYRPMRNDVALIATPQPVSAADIV